MNCWEYKKCGREKGGANAEKEGVCPAYPNHGNNCAQIAGTLCGVTVTGTFACSLGNCMLCDFYHTDNHRDRLAVRLSASTSLRVNKSPDLRHMIPHQG